MLLEVTGPKMSETELKNEKEGKETKWEGENVNCRVEPILYCFKTQSQLTIS